MDPLSLAVGLVLGQSTGPREVGNAEAIAIWAILAVVGGLIGWILSR